MKPKKIWANLGVEDTERTKKFYRDLGFELNGTPTEELVSFFFGEERFIIHFFEKSRLRNSIEGALSDLNNGNEIIFSLGAGSKKEYDGWVEELKRVGAKVLFDSNKDRKALYDEHGFFVCVFTDPDGHKFNLLYSANM